MSYYNIDAILTDAQKIPCTFEIPVPGLGFLDENPGGDIPAHTPLPLPLYLAILLAIQRLSPSSPPLVSIDLPASLGPRVLNALRADARTVDLRSLEVGFYEGAARVLELLEDDDDDDGDGGPGGGGGVGGVVAEAFKVRAAEIADHARNTGRGAGGGEGEGFLRGLEEWERKLFRAAHDGSKAVRVWMGEVKKKK